MAEVVMSSGNTDSVYMNDNGEVWIHPVNRYDKQISTGVVSSQYGPIVSVGTNGYVMAGTNKGFTTPYGQYVYKSTDYGDTWSTVKSNINFQWQSISISDSGEHQYASVLNPAGTPFPGTIPFYQLWRSHDYGETWDTGVTLSGSWTYGPIPVVKTSPSGQYITSMGSYKSSDYGETWTNDSVSGSAFEVDDSGTVTGYGTYSPGADIGAAWSENTGLRIVRNHGAPYTTYVEWEYGTTSIVSAPSSYIIGTSYGPVDTSYQGYVMAMVSYYQYGNALKLTIWK